MTITVTLPLLLLLLRRRQRRRLPLLIIIILIIILTTMMMVSIKKYKNNNNKNNNDDNDDDDNNNSNFNNNNSNNNNNNNNNNKTVTISSYCWFIAYRANDTYDIPVQFFPSPWYPSRHLQVYDPLVLLQEAFEWHPFVSVLKHSSISETIEDSRWIKVGQNSLSCPYTFRTKILKVRICFHK